MANRFLGALLKTFVFMAILILLCFAIRIAFILYLGVFHGALWSGGSSENIVSQIGLLFYNGFIHDNRGVAAFTIPFFLIALRDVFRKNTSSQEFGDTPPPTSNRLLDYYAYFVFGLFLFISIANFTYYTIYQDVFNIILLGIFFDDQKAILEDGLSGRYFLTVKFIAFFISLLCVIWLYKKISFKLQIPHKVKKVRFYGFSLFALLIVLLTCFINGGFSLASRSLDQELRPVANLFLRKITPSPFRSLYQVYKGYKAGDKSSFASFSSDTPAVAVEEFFKLPLNHQKQYDLSKLLEQTSDSKDGVPKINYIFYIIAESLGNYAFDPIYDEIGLVSGMKGLVDGENGFQIPYFFENAHGTIWSLESQISGLYYTGIRLSFKSALLQEMPTAPAGNLKRAGYLTRFYYGGGENWQNLDAFTKSQGFDEHYGTGAMEGFAMQNYPKPYRNVWGVWDNILFDYIATNSAQTQKPTFNMIMTTSFHGPNDLPWEFVEKIGGNRQKLQSFIDKHPGLNWQFNELSILWWFDKEVARFIKEFSKEHPDSLFIITGDHSHYSFAKTYQSSREVPMIIYSPKLKIKPISEIGVHLDITPTIINLVAPKGFVYHSFGKPLFSSNPQAKIDKNRKIIGFEIGGDAHQLYTQHHQRFNPKNSELKPILEKGAFEDFLRHYRNSQALSWYLYSKGEKIEN